MANAAHLERIMKKHFGPEYTYMWIRNDDDSRQKLLELNMQGMEIGQNDVHGFYPFYVELRGEPVLLTVWTDTSSLMPHWKFIYLDMKCRNYHQGLNIEVAYLAKVTKDARMDFSLYDTMQQDYAAKHLEAKVRESDALLVSDSSTSIHLGTDYFNEGEESIFANGINTMKYGGEFTWVPSEEQACAVPLMLNQE
ncbi:hypothetical protein AJ79_01822 [Helicocarpus griseus UAMH5409]|uniref:Uncharacterized protein n=1 Tax=Helicocarpus griseus UAMH5409 TaxID=1447875 RepID=A0A2B7Y5I7_9EURO|nr:hypothetical protein AJ79_01822 [Helicocarpus griseus UAMH5409]